MKADVLTRLNAIRALHRLPAVRYSEVDDAQVMEASLMMAANGMLDHMPPNTWKCWTQTGYDGAASSNLYGGTISPFLGFNSEDDYLAGWMTEVNNLVANNVGHRRWMLDPFLGSIAYGRVAQTLADGTRTDAAALKVFGFAGSVAAPTALPDFVAYPYGDYPARYFDARALLSFSVISNPASRGQNANVDFSNATVVVRDAAGAAMTIGNVSYDTIGFGLPNNIQWTVAGLVAGTRYTVTISGVVVSGTSKNYTYEFRVVN